MNVCLLTVVTLLIIGAISCSVTEAVPQTSTQTSTSAGTSEQTTAQGTDKLSTQNVSTTTTSKTPSTPRPEDKKKSMTVLETNEKDDNMFLNGTTFKRVTNTPPIVMVDPCSKPGNKKCLEVTSKKPPSSETKVVVTEATGNQTKPPGGFGKNEQRTKKQNVEVTTSKSSSSSSSSSTAAATTTVKVVEQTRHWSVSSGTRNSTKSVPSSKTRPGLVSETLEVDSWERFHFDRSDNSHLPEQKHLQPMFKDAGLTSTHFVLLGVTTALFVVMVILFGVFVVRKQDNRNSWKRKLGWDKKTKRMDMQALRLNTANDLRLTLNGIPGDIYVDMSKDSSVVA